MRDPDYEGKFGKAWILSIDSPRTPAQYAAVYAALIYAPRAHPAWAWHLLSLVSLRDIKGTSPAKKQYPEAEHELLVLAIDPKTHPNPDPDNKMGWTFLQPRDVVIQFHGIDAAQAREIADLATQCCVDGNLVPDSDFENDWGEKIALTIKHMLEGIH